jgi:hypothetical protein
MSWHRRVATTCCVVALLAAVGGGARAEGIALGPAGEAALASVGNVTFSAGVSIRCNVTLRASLDSAPTPIRAGLAVGTVTGVSFGACEGGAVRGVLSLPWSLTYSSLSGTPPEELTALELVIERAKWGFSVLGGFINCLYEGNLPLSVPLSTDDPYAVGLTTVLTNSMRLISGGFGCPATGSFSGRFAQIAQAMAYVPPGGSNHASPEVVHSAEAAAPGKEVELVSGGGTISIENASWKRGATGWTATAENCVLISLEIGRNCQFRVISEARARANALRFFSGGAPLITVYAEP